MRVFYTHKYENIPNVETMLEKLADKDTAVADYRNAFFCIGKELGNVLRHQLPDDYNETTFVACASEDADWLAKGLLSGLDAPKLPIAVFWSGRTTLSNGIDVSPIIKSYSDEVPANCRSLVITKSIISSSCVVKTQLLRLISNLTPETIFILAPVMFKDAEINLKNEFPAEIADKFRFITFAIDDEIVDNEIIPGIGGMVYPRLGLGRDSNTKNQYMPAIVLERMAATTY